MKILEYLARIMKRIKKLRIPSEHYENHLNLKIQRENYKSHEA